MVCYFVVLCRLLMATCKFKKRHWIKIHFQASIKFPAYDGQLIFCLSLWLSLNTPVCAAVHYAISSPHQSSNPNDIFHVGLILLHRSIVLLVLFLVVLHGWYTLLLFSWSLGRVLSRIKLVNHSDTQFLLL